LPLGDSITYGEGSSDGNGYRRLLYDLLTPGYEVQYIGREHDGSMPNNNHEGHGGFGIGPVGETGKPDYAEQPDVVLLMAGTNDVVFDIDLKNAPKTLMRVVDDIVKACPKAAVLVANLIPLLGAERETRRIQFNNALPGAVAARTGAADDRVSLVDMGTVNASFINTTDGVHPTDEGYKLIAAAWYEAIVAASDKGWVPKMSSLSGGRRGTQWAGQLFVACVVLGAIFFVVRRVLFRRKSGSWMQPLPLTRAPEV
jgi:lysophospholipase L1-like esterase